LREQIHPSHHDSSDDETFEPSSQALFIQPSFINTQPSAPIQPAAPSASQKYCKAPSAIVEVDHVPPEDKAIITEAVADLYPSINAFGDFQYEAIHHLAFHDDPSLVPCACSTERSWP
jgi:hypothetical protein